MSFISNVISCLLRSNYDVGTKETYGLKIYSKTKKILPSKCPDIFKRENGIKLISVSKTKYDLYRSWNLNFTPAFPGYPNAVLFMKNNDSCSQPTLSTVTFINIVALIYQGLVLLKHLVSMTKWSLCRVLRWQEIKLDVG
jgi:hypothetical protein